MISKQLRVQGRSASAFRLFSRPTRCLLCSFACHLHKRRGPDTRCTPPRICNSGRILEEQKRRRPPNECVARRENRIDVSMELGSSDSTSKMPDRGAIPDLSGAQHLQRRARKVAHSRTHAAAQAHRFAQIDFKSGHHAQYINLDGSSRCGLLLPFTHK